MCNFAPRNYIKRMKTRIVLILMLMIPLLCTAQTEETPNARQARRIFNSAYQQVFGEQGATLHYDVNIIGIYKTNGTIWYKGKKSKFVDEKMNSWNDGTTVYTIKARKRSRPCRQRRQRLFSLLSLCLIFYLSLKPR